MLEHGAYRLLLDRYYSTEEGIPAAQAYRLARARSEEERQAVDVVLEEFFELVDGVWINGRAEEEIASAQVRIEAAKQNGKRGGRPRKNPLGSKNETQQKPSGFPMGSENETQQKAHQAPDTSSKPSSPTAQARETGPPTSDCSQMRSDWAPSPTFSTLAHQAGLPIPGNAEFESARVEFVAYWLTRPDQRTQNEWDHAFIRSLKNDRIRAQSAPQHEVRHGKSRRRTAAEQRADTIAALTGRDDADARTIAGEARVVD